MNTLKIIASIIFFIMSQTIIAQGYFNYAITLNEKSPLVNEMIINHGEYIIPYDYIKNDTGQAAILITDFKNSQDIELGLFNLAAHPFSPRVGLDYIFGELRFESSDNKFAIRKLTTDFEEEWTKEYETSGVRQVSNDFIKAYDEFYALNTIWQNETDLIISLSKIDSLGRLIWSKEIGNDEEYAYGRKLFQMDDGNLLISQNLRFSLDPRSHGRLIKLDTSGQIIWDHHAVELSAHGGSPINVTELSNGMVVYNDIVDRWSDVEFIINDWDRFPFEFRWLDKNGNKVNKKMLTWPRQDELYFHKIESGQGDYFFGFGEYEDSDNVSCGFITKFSNLGDTIWTKRFQQPDFQGEENNHYILDIVEHENGDISALGGINSRESGVKIWVFKINSHGCFGETDCDEFLTTEVINHDLVRNNRVNPNPTSGLITINLNEEERVSFYNVNGEIIRVNRVEKQYDFLHVPSGIYIVRIVDKFGNISTEKVIVQH